jgi:phage gp36-like protein
MAAANKKIELRHTVANVLTDATSVKFSDPNGTFGVKRVDNDQIVIADDSDMPKVATGTYQYILDAAVHDIQLVGMIAGVTYSYWLEWVFNGITKWQNNEFVARDAVVTPISIYTTWSHFKRRWGIKNITVASQKDGKATDPDLEVVQDALDYATDEIHDSLRGGVLAVPLDFTAYAGKIPGCVREWAEILAFAKLYDARGWEDTNKKGNKLTKQVMNVYSEMGLVKLGAKQIEASIAVSSAGETITPAPSHINALGQCVRYVDGHLVCS